VGRGRGHARVDPVSDGRASLIGIVKAWVVVAELSWLPDMADAAVLTPITWPWVLMSGPPESPGSMPALVQIMPEAARSYRTTRRQP
jgi:hypothetical protein